MTRALAGLLIGRTLCDRYTIDELVGRGGMSLVYRGRDLRLHRDVAVKVISLPADSEAGHLRLRERLRREAAAAARVPPHPNVVQVYDYGTDDALDLDFIAMELLHGRDLKSILREGPPPYGDAIRILLETARGLSAGHRAGIVHRDVKPANIVVLDEEPRTVKLLDFGIAKALESAAGDDLTRAGEIPHSPNYASPEQLREGGGVTPASDVYQLGLVAYEMLAGGRRGRRQSAAGPVAESDRWQAVPEAVRTVVEAALRPDPASRYRDAASFAEALSRATDRSAATVFLPPVARDPDEATVVDREGAEVTPPAAAVAPPRGAGRRPADHRRGGSLVVLGILAVLLAVGLLRALEVIRPDRPAARSGQLDSEIQALDEEFRDLLVEARENLRERGEELSPQSARR